MKRTVPVLFVGLVLGYAASHVSHVVSVVAQQAPLRPYRNGAPPPDIPPTPGLPLYPAGDEPAPNKPMHWKWADLQAIHAARAADMRGGGGPGGGSAPRFEGQQFRTHQIGLGFRQRFRTARPSNTTGIISHYDDADQHEGAPDFYVMVGGKGTFIVDGVIKDRQVGRLPGPDRNRGTEYPIMPGEFHGQPVVNGSVYEGHAGDWLAIPPGIPHWWNPDPNEGMTYLLFKLYLNSYPRSLID